MVFVTVIYSGTAYRFLIITSDPYVERGRKNSRWSLSYSFTAYRLLQIQILSPLKTSENHLPLQTAITSDPYLDRGLTIPSRRLALLTVYTLITSDCCQLQLARDGNMYGLGMSHATTASPKPPFRAPWRVGDAMVGRGNAGWTASKSGHSCPCQNCLQWPPAEKD